MIINDRYDVFSIDPQVFLSIDGLPVNCYKCHNLSYIICPSSEESPEIPGITKVFRNKPLSSVNLLKGFDWLISQRPDIVSISLGPDKIAGDDPLRIAFFVLYYFNIPVVVAAGNKGELGQGTLQAFAQFPEVISVGATDENQKMLPLSSKGEVDGICPTLVTDGTSSSDDFIIPSTSFAAPKITGLAMYLQTYLKYLVDEIFSPDEDHLFGSKVSAPVVGSLDTGYDPNRAFHDSLEKLYLKKEYSSIRMVRSEEEREWYKQYANFLMTSNVTVKPLINPEIVKKCLELSAIPLPDYAIYETGAGYLDGSSLDRFLSTLTPSKLTNIVFPDIMKEGSSVELLNQLDQSLGPIKNDLSLTGIRKYIVAGHKLVVARVLEGDGPHGTVALSLLSYLIPKLEGNVAYISI